MPTDQLYADVKSLWREHEALAAEIKSLRLQGKVFEQRIASLEGRSGDSTEAGEQISHNLKVLPPRSEPRGVAAELQESAVIVPSQAPVPTPQMPPADTWAVDPVRLDMYRNAFLRVDTDGDGFAAQSEVKELLNRAGLPENEARSIWSMVDVNKRGCLNFEEFASAMYIAFRRSKQGVVLPDRLPPELIAIAMPGSSTPVALSNTNPLLQDVVVSLAPPSGSAPAEPSNANSLPRALAKTSSALLEPSKVKPEVTKRPFAADTPGEPDDAWEIDMNRLQMYEGAFRKADSNSDGFVEPLDVREVLTRAGLPDLENNMKTIWSLVDLNRRGRLNFGEFACGMFMAFRYGKQGVSLPAEIPTPLRGIVASNIGSASEAAPFLGGTSTSLRPEALPAISTLPVASSESVASKPPVSANREVDPFDDLSW